MHTCGTRRHSSYILWPRLVANLQQKHQLKNRMKGFHAAALACLALAHAIAPPGGEALVDGEIARGRERDQDGNFFDGGPCIKKSLRKGNLGARRRRDCKRPTWQLLRRRPVHERADEMQRRSVLSDRLVALRARIYELSNSRWTGRQVLLADARPTPGAVEVALPSPPKVRS